MPSSDDEVTPLPPAPLVEQPAPAGVDPRTPFGLELCEECGAPAARRGNRYAVHFASPKAKEPCPSSWPPTRSKP